MGESLNVYGYETVVVDYEDKLYKKLKLYVVDGGNTALLGRDWLQKIQLNWKNIEFVHSVRAEQTTDLLQELKNRYADLFDDKLGKLKDFQAKLHLMENAKPVFKKARPIPYAMREKVEKELDRLEQDGVISETVTSEWATPIVPLVKRNFQIRIYGDYKVTVNPLLKVDRYPMPRPQDIFASLAGGEKFPKLDLHQAYLQCEVDESSSEVLTLNTHRGLYRLHQLAFGIASSPAI
jgi:hypothetical protein